MKIGYARISTRDQSVDLQHDALRKAGCKRLYTDVASGAKTARPALDDMLANTREGDVIVIWKLDRLGRSLAHLIELVAELSARGIGVKSLNDPINTTTAQGRLIFNIFGSLAEFERELIRERTQAGLTAARARGRVGGRPKGLSSRAETTAAAAETLYCDGKLSVSAICEKLGIGKNTLYRYLRHRGVEPGPQKKSGNQQSASVEPGISDEEAKPLTLETLEVPKRKRGRPRKEVLQAAQPEVVNTPKTAKQKSVRTAKKKQAKPIPAGLAVEAAIEQRVSAKDAEPLAPVAPKRKRGRPRKAV
jgi:DNA invertase Pin-like site-specific DNA recombinase